MLTAVTKVRYVQRFRAPLVVLAILVSLGACSTDQAAQREGAALTNLRDNVLPAERRDREAKYESCKAALGRDPRAMAENEEAATKFLFPLPACNDYLVAKDRYDSDRQDFLRRAQALDAYNAQKRAATLAAWDIGTQSMSNSFGDMQNNIYRNQAFENQLQQQQQQVNEVNALRALQPAPSVAPINGW